MTETQNNPQPTRTGRYRGSFIFPIILISIGVVYLLRNMGVLSGDAWNLVLRLWPVLLIGIGLDSLFQRQGVAGPVFWIGVGSVLLLSTLGVVDWNVFGVILNLWPVLLIAIGLDLAIARRSALGAVISMVVILAILAGALWYLGGFGPSISQAGSGEPVSQAVDGATQVAVMLRPAVGSILIQPLQDAGSAETLVSGEVRRARSETIHTDYQVSGKEGDFSMTSEGMRMFFPSIGSASWSWDLDFNPAVPLEFDIDLGMGDVRLDLQDLQVNDVHGDIGLGRVEVTLPEQGSLEVDINGAMGETIIIVPAGVEVRLQADTAMSFVSAPDGYTRDEHTYTSPGYATAENRVDLNLSQAMGHIEVRAEK
ncbi:MAG: hypothetical protein EHM70_23215 [Chloroflexota bacterium]|nr:MAG: hypothetical protein EHM70_23215 [Chloroflexota bacterium]